MTQPFAPLARHAERVARWAVDLLNLGPDQARRNAAAAVATLTADRAAARDTGGPRGPR